MDGVEPSPVAEQCVELDDGLLLLQRELAPLDVRPQVVGPPEPAALAAAHQPWIHEQEQQQKRVKESPT